MKNKTLIYFSIFLLFIPHVHGAIPNNPISIVQNVGNSITPKAGEIILLQNNHPIDVFVQEAKQGKYYLIAEDFSSAIQISDNTTPSVILAQLYKNTIFKTSDSISPYLKNLSETYFAKLIHVLENFLLLKLNIPPTKDEIKTAKFVMGYFPIRINNNEAKAIAHRLGILQSIIIRQSFYSAWENVQANIQNPDFNKMMLARSEGIDHYFQRYLKLVATQPLEQFIEPVKKILREMFRVAKTKYQIPNMLVLDSVLENPTRSNLEKTQDWINNYVVHNIIMPIYNKATEEGKGLLILTSTQVTEHSPLPEKLKSAVHVSRCEKGFSPRVTGVML